MTPETPTAPPAAPRPVYHEVCPVCLGYRYAERFRDSQIGIPSGRCSYCAGTGYVVYEAPEQ